MSAMLFSVFCVKIVLVAVDGKLILSERFVRNKHPEALGKPYRTTWEEIYAIPETAASLNEIWNRYVLIARQPSGE